MVGRVRAVALIFLVAAVALAEAYGIKPGHYFGRWAGNAAEGSIDLVLEGTDKKLKTARITFTFNGEEIKTQLREMKQAGDSIEIRYEYELQDTPLVSNLKGSLQGKKLSGTYTATQRDGGGVVDEGTWNAELQ